CMQGLEFPFYSF
nr:immunoglobulin light chain junction region [Macaca mulatta]